MNWNPQTEEEIQAERRKKLQILAAGECDFVVKSAEDYVSEKGNESILVQAQVTDAEGTTKVIKDYLTPAFAHKFRHFFYAVGLGHAYEQGSVETGEIEGRSGRCVIRVKKEKWDDGKMHEKNEISDYVVADSTKQGAGYQQKKAEAAPQGKPEPTEAAKFRMIAFRAFQAAYANLDKDALAAAWKDACQAYFKKPQDHVTAAGWQQFVGDDFVKKTPANPIDEEPVFAESDIPF